MTALRSGELAAAAGVNPQTLRYYERRGLLPVPDRSLGGHRMYPTEALERLRVIKAAQRLGFTLDDVGAMLGAGHTGRSGPGLRAGAGPRAGAGLRSRAESRLAQVEAELADLAAVAATLRAALAAGCDDLADCAHEPTCPIPFDAAG